MTAALIGGNSVGGGRGSVGKALMGAVIVSLLTNGLVRLGLAERRIVDGGRSRLAACDRRSMCAGSNGGTKLQAKVYVSPAYLALPAAPAIDRGSPSPYAMNDRLRDVEIIGLGEVEGPEDVILDWRRQSLLQRAARRYRPLSRSRLYPARSLRACRRTAARPGL